MNRRFFMKSLFENLKSFFKYDHKAVIKRFASDELDSINYEIRQLQERRDQLESMVYGN